MVSRRIFFSICAMMAILLFMFQALQVYKQSENVYDTNEYVQESVLSGEEQWQMDTVNTQAGTARERDYILFIGDAEGSIGDVVKQWCLYTKRMLVAKPRIEEAVTVVEVSKELPKMIVVEAAQVDYSNKLEFFDAMAEEGVSIIFCELPEPSVIESNEELMDMLGIQSVSSSKVNVEGIQLFSGFLFGGEEVFKVEPTEEQEKEELQDLELEMPWYVTGKGTKTYMVGLLDEEEYEREWFPAVIWRNRYEDAFVFAINGDYVSGFMGLGILNACEYEAENYTIYPVVNARNTLLANSPILADENEEKLMETYSRKPSAVLRDVMWPGISAMANRNHLKLTCFAMPQYDYRDDVEPDGENMVYYLQQMKEINAEAGKSLTYKAGVTLAEKLARDDIFWESLDSEYQYRAYFAEDGITDEIGAALKNGSLEEVRTIAGFCEEQTPIVSYYNGDVTVQGITGEVNDYSFSEELHSKGLLTALGYSNVLIDMRQAMWPETEEDEWQNYFDEISSNMDTYWSSGEAFAATTLTESDARVRSFLNLDYSQNRIGDVIWLRTEGYGEEAWFVLRTHGEEIVKSTGAEYYKIEEDAYLINVLSEEVVLQLGKAEEQLDFYFSK